MNAALYNNILYEPRYKYALINLHIIIISIVFNCSELAECENKKHRVKLKKIKK